MKAKKQLLRYVAKMMHIRKNFFCYYSSINFLKESVLTNEGVNRVLEQILHPRDRWRERYFDYAMKLRLSVRKTTFGFRIITQNASHFNK